MTTLDDVDHCHKAMLETMLGWCGECEDGGREGRIEIWNSTRHCPMFKLDLLKDMLRCHLCVVGMRSRQDQLRTKH